MAHVRIHRVRRIRCANTRSEREAADAPATLRSIASSSGISLELRIFLRKGSFHFIRVCDNFFIEPGRDGMPLPAPVA
jgi:hypothetical protein